MAWYNKSQVADTYSWSEIPKSKNNKAFFTVSLSSFGETKSILGVKWGKATFLPLNET